MVKIIECTREYIVTDATYMKCDLCKLFFAKVFDLTPVKKTHSFDNIVLCSNCIDKCQLLFKMDVNELTKAGSVEEWEKTN